MMKSGNKKTVLLVVLIILLTAGTVVFWWLYNTYYLPSKRINNTYIEVYQDVDATDINTISINTIDHKVVIKPTDDEKVKISYFQKVDNSNSFTINNHVVSLRMIEKAENLDNIFYQNTRLIDTITIYIPTDRLLELQNTTIGGSLTVSGVQLNVLTATSLSGNIEISDSKINRLNLETNYGDIVLNNNEFTDLDVNSVDGVTKLSLIDSLSLYNVDIKSNYGTLLVNNERVKETIDGVETIVNRLAWDAASEKSINISAVRTNITITSVEVYEEPEQQLPEETEEETEEKES